jgi:hypothetical protein
MIGARLLSRSRSLPKLVDKRDLGVEEAKTRSKFVIRSSLPAAYGHVTRMSLVSHIFYCGDSICERTIILPVVLFGGETCLWHGRKDIG